MRATLFLALVASATGVISGVTTDTSALLIKFDLRSYVGATLVPGKSAWLNYFVSDAGNNASLRELVVPWSESTVTWNNLPFASASWRPTNVPSGTTGTFPGVLGWNRFDVTSSVAAWLAAAPPPAFSYVFNGENSSYTGGCQSTWIRSDNPDYIGAQDTGLWWDGSSSTGHYDSVLVQFPDIIGSGPNQLRPHEYIQRATLRYNVDETFSANAPGASAQLHEISKEWSANSTTFRTFAGAQGLNEAEYRTPAITTALANRTGWFEIDVTASVQSWVNGVGNNGWIWMPSPQYLGGSGDGSSMRACNAPPNVRVNLV
ncbi:serine threonine phosphatase, partial [Chrysochromulina tobinii]